jgi:general stress protein CsbA
LFLPLLWEYYSAQRGKLTTKQLPSLLLIPLGTASFLLYHYLVFGDFFLFFKVEGWWGRAFRPSMDHFLMLTHAASANFILDVMFVVFALVATYFVWKRLRPSYALYMLITILVALSTGTLMSIGRYIAVLFPIYLLGASIKNEYIKYSWIFVSILLLAMNITLFVHYYWAG